MSSRNWGRSPGAKPEMPPLQQATVSKRQVQRLVKLAKNFDKAVETLPDKGEEYKREQLEVADTRKKAQMNEGLLRLRVR